MSITLEAGTPATIGSTELNSLANGGRALGAAFDNNAAGNRDFWALFTLTVTWGTAPTAGAFIPLWLIPAPDGTNYLHTITTVDPSPEYFVGNFVVPTNVTTIQRMGCYAQLGRFLACPYKPFIRNASGQAFPASGSTLTILANRIQ